MSNLISHSDDLSIMAAKEFQKAIKDIQSDIKEKHEKVSKEETNPNHVKQKAGMDYVEFQYMKNKANEHYPGWSFKNLKIVEEFLVSGWVVVKGELHFIDEGMPRTGACAAAHRIAFKSGKDRIPENIVDLGNDVKAAVSDAMKKGFNTYMNISDDIYRALEIVDIDEDEKQFLYDIISDCNPTEQRKFYNFVDNNTTKANFKDIVKKTLGALYKYQKPINEKEATKLLTKYKKQAKEEFDISLEK